MAIIEANDEGKIHMAQKRLKSNLNKLRNTSGLSPAQRESLLTKALVDLHMIELWRLGRLSEVE